jgi:hypothetical protein
MCQQFTMAGIDLGGIFIFSTHNVNNVGSNPSMKRNAGIR